MGQLDTQVSRSLTRYYILALSAVAILSLAGQVLIQFSLRNVLDDARVINIAGRQRMLSQRLTKRAILLCNPKIYLPGSEYNPKDFVQFFSLWQECHTGLQKGVLEKKVVVKKSHALDSLFQTIEPHFQAMAGGFQVIGKEINQKNPHEARMKVALTQILVHEQQFLNTMDRIVFQYDTETKLRVDRVRNIEFMLSVITFVVLFLEGVFIFRPVVEHTQDVIRRLLHSEAKLQRTNKELWQTNESLLNTKQELLETTEEKYRLQQEENKVRSVALLEGQEEERRRISRELHDGIGQMLTGLKLHSETLKDVAFTNEKQKKNYEELNRLIIETIEATRTVSFNLMPSVLNDFGVTAAIRLLAEQNSKTYNLTIRTDGLENIGRLSQNIEIGLYRIVQEAINNTIKHAKAKQITLSLRKKRSDIELIIADDGQGFDTKKLNQRHTQLMLTGNGISNMRTRAGLLGGSLKISSSSDKGTQISVKIPIHEV